MSTAHAILISLSPKRLALLESEPEMLEDVIEARHEEPIPGLLDLGTAWETLDMLLSGRGRDELLGDVLLARTGKRFEAGDAFEASRVPSPQRVAQAPAQPAATHSAIGRIRQGPRGSCTASSPTPSTDWARANAGNARALPATEPLYEKVVAAFPGAAKSKQSMLSVLV